MSSFPSFGRTQDALKSGHFVSVLHVLMQLQKICNHPNLINPRLSSSSYVSEVLQYRTASLVLKVLEHDIWKVSEVTVFTGPPTFVSCIHIFCDVISPPYHGGLPLLKSQNEYNIK